jgi:nucleoside-diphosphate-sugar epimerase
VNSPALIDSTEALDELLSRPTAALVSAIQSLRSPLLVFGASGKMGPSLCVQARRAATAAQVDLRIVAISRFSDPRTRPWLEAQGVETMVADALDRRGLEPLPDSENVVYLVGLKFGTRQNPSLTWAVNALAPAHVAERFPTARIVALSTGNLYRLTPVASGGATENDAPAPVGEYAGAALARERIFEHCSRIRGTPIVVLRLNYAVELRYGVLREIAQKVWAKEPIDLTTGYFNCIWQGDANEMILRSFPLTAAPPAVFNLTSPATLSVRDLAERFGQQMGRTPVFVGAAADTALLSNPNRLCDALGSPPTALEDMVRWTAAWVMDGRESFNKATHFQVRDGRY